MSKIKVGVLGGFRGGSMIKYCEIAENAEIVAICDKIPEVLNAQKKWTEGNNVALYESFDEFIEYDMDAVVLANYANEHRCNGEPRLERLPMQELSPHQRR